MIVMRVNVQRAAAAAATEQAAAWGHGRTGSHENFNLQARNETVSMRVPTDSPQHAQSK